MFLCFPMSVHVVWGVFVFLCMLGFLSFTVVCVLFKIVFVGGVGGFVCGLVVIVIRRSVSTFSCFLCCIVVDGHV